MQKTLTLTTLLLLSVGQIALAETAAKPDTSEWVCELCPFSDGLNGDVAAGPGYVSDDNPDFGNFGGLEEEGAFVALEGDLWYRGDDGRYFLAYGDRLGLDSRHLALEGGRQGGYRLALDWKEIPWIWSDDARTFYNGAGTSNQTLPAGWVTGNTSDMALLEPNLRDIRIGHQRETVKLGAELTRPSPWRSRVDFQHTRREGNFVKGASFLFTGTELVAPLDEETTLVEAAVGYVRESWQLEGAYQVSLFESNDNSVRWDNPFPSFNGGDRGELSLAPDNEFHQFVVSGSWRPSRAWNVAGQVAFGRATQDEAFLAPTLNDSLAVPALPVTSLDGQVDTRIANFRVNGHFSDRLRGRLVVRYDDRDNATDQNLYTAAVTDTFVAGPFANQPYSYERRSAEAALDYRVRRELILTASASREATDRDFQEVGETTTNGFSLGARANPDERLTVRAKIARESRSNDLDPALLNPFENPALRRYHFAEKDRDLFRLAADLAINERWTAGAFVELAEERYDDTMIGLSEADSQQFGLDLSARFGRAITASGFVARELLDAEILGADNIIGAPWRATTDDEFLTAGLALDFAELPGRWMNAGLRLTYASADGEIQIEKRGDAPPFPELQTRRYLLEADIERELGERLSLNLGYMLARAREDDFYRDGVGPTTLPNYISLGKVSPDRTVHVFRMMLRYRFQ
ncbi:MtrB/PioB family decaheme-associated outer membrane protein [Wenzhouxiangella limi]|uniref:MtrB/PioB family decaheme-associated outer membrane protein n=1 Tax=Wenzhouxiangella limi TaxID=2707351 RepID=A0A845UZJ3_9GAMM|nr:MtrB/PioB family decaheme-associated outer membrane protein [Wenzhouxiangella limi]NDY95712.1 MtrB/PioB family decaheme-associated outer membrane protein [Wenzhouxiangella limi]